ncbi:hypothetical protein ACFU96_03955 [Streptomyces sp. NPDC057620]|uniref:hypothetical protein n=1 Tax=Streptomyces sp. NPDC057620 TaxID=3346185 RepID=UPI0036CFC018
MDSTSAVHRVGPPAVHVTGDRALAELARYQPSYRFQSWFLDRQGYPLDGDNLGDDQPDRVAAQYRSEFAWLHRTPTDPAA